jgi:hypothetical protein
MRSRTLALGLTTTLAAVLSACVTTTTEDAGPGTCGTNAQPCELATDCCDGFACVTGRCTFEGGGNASAGNSSGGSAGSSSGGTHSGNGASSGGNQGSGGVNGTSTGTGGSSTGSATSGSTTGAAGCSTTVTPFNEYGSCTSAASCACPMGCVANGSNGSICLESCASAGDCTGPYDICTNGYCVPNTNCTATQLCTDVTSDDSTCVEIASGGQVASVCIKGGSIPLGGSCNLGNLSPQSTPPPASELCAPGSFCDGTPGVCQLVCTVGAGGACASGQTCTTFTGLASTFGVCEPTGGNTGGTTGGNSSGTGGFTPAAHQSLPPMEANGISPLTAPQLVTLSYAGYESSYPVGSYADWLVTSPWLQTVGAPYGIGTGSHIDVQLAASGPSSTTVQDSDIQSFIWNYVSDAGSLPHPSGTSPSTIYMIYYPQDVTISAGTTGTSCAEFGGYHSSFTDGNGTVWVYAVIPTCANFEPGLTTQQDLEFSTSHEFIEAATDPSFNQSTEASGYTLEWDYTDSWAFDLQEVADVCVGAPLVTYGSDLAQEVWGVVGSSDADSPPCSPWPSGAVYYNVSPVAQGFSNGLAYFPSNSVPATVTFDITGWSNAATSAWTLYPVQTVGTFQLSTTAFSLSAPGQTAGPGPTISMNNGTTATLTITLPSGLASGSYAAVELLSSQDFQATPLTYNEWPLAIYIE